MRRIAVVIAFFALAAPAQAAAPASVELMTCAPRDRAAEFEARMGKVEDGVKMKMRFTLQARKPGKKKPYRRVAAPGFSSWTTADTGTSRYVFTRRVEGLIGPARYRALVRFRWIDARGKVILTAKRYSKGCWQPDHRPNLKVKALSREGKRRYVALVANNGRTATGPFDLQVAVGDTLLEPVPVLSLEPGTQTLVTVRGPICSAGTALTATADPLNLVDERNEDDNAFTVPCA
jgi:CARDB